MNNKGREELLSLWWIFVLAIIGAGIVAGTLMFYSADINVKSAEADILAKRVADCISSNGMLNERFLGTFDIAKECGLAQSSLDSGVFFVKAVLYDGAGKIVKEVVAGDASIEKDCSIARVVIAKKYPKCSSLSFSVNYQGLNKGTIKINAGSNNVGGRDLAVK